MSNKDKPYSGTFPGSCQTGQNNDSSLGMELLRVLQPSVPHPVIAGLLVFTAPVTARLRVFKSTADLGTQE